MKNGKYYRELPEGYSKIGKTPRAIAKTLADVIVVPCLFFSFYSIVMEKLNLFSLTEALNWIYQTPVLNWFYPIAKLKTEEKILLSVGAFVCWCLSPVHEILHRLGFRVFAGCVETKSVLNKKGEEIHAEAKGFFTKAQTAPTSLLPCSVFTVLGSLLFVLTSGFFRQIAIGFVITNFYLCVGDIFDFFWELTRPKNTLFEIPGDTIIAYRKDYV